MFPHSREIFSESGKIKPKQDCNYLFFDWFSTKLTSVWCLIGRGIGVKSMMPIVSCQINRKRAFFLPFSDWFSAKRTSVWCQIKPKSVFTIRNFVWFSQPRKTFLCVATEEIIKFPQRANNRQIFSLTNSANLHRLGFFEETGVPRRPKGGLIKPPPPWSPDLQSGSLGVQFDWKIVIIIQI